MKKYLLRISGINQEIIKEFPNEQVKYACIGASLLLTAFLAILSGGYALYTVFDHWQIYVPIAFLWGIIIFNIDLYFISSYKKKNNKIKEVISLLPRIALAGAIAFIVAVPLELKIFEKEIATRINNDLDKFKENFVKESFQSNELRRLEEEKKGNSQVNELKLIKENLNKAEEELIDEIQGEVGSGIRGDGPAARAIKKRIGKLEESKIILEKAVNEYEELYNSRKLEIEQSLNTDLEKELESRRNYGFLKRITTITTLGNENSAVKYTAYGLMILLMILELAPMFFKFFSPKDGYEYRVEEELLKVKMEINQRNNIKATEIAVEKSIREKKAVQNLMKKNEEYQAELIELRATKYRLLMEKILGLVDPNDPSYKEYSNELNRLFVSKLGPVIFNNSSYSKEEIRKILKNEILQIKGTENIDQDVLTRQINELNETIASIKQNQSNNQTIIIDPNKE